MRAAFVLACITFALAWSYFQPFDDSDTPPKRSGVIPFTDALTGCQYLKTPWPSSITPRLGQDGKQICKKDTP